MHYDHTDNSMGFYVNANERMQINDQGNIGVGTTNIDHRLTIKGGNNNDILRGENWSNTKTLFTIAADNDDTAVRLNDDSGNTKIQLHSDGMTFFNGGNFGIGTDMPGFLLHVNGSAGKPGGGSWDSASDIRLKNVIGKYQKGLKEIMGIDPIYYSYKDENPLNLPSDKIFIGVSAQELQNNIPEAIGEYQDGYLSVNNDPVIWTMINAIKELKIENEKLGERIRDLEIVE